MTRKRKEQRLLPRNVVEKSNREFELRKGHSRPAVTREQLMDEIAEQIALAVAIEEKTVEVDDLVVQSYRELLEEENLRLATLQNIADSNARHIRRFVENIIHSV
jgi:hypothetical protein